MCIVLSQYICGRRYSSRSELMQAALRVVSVPGQQRLYNALIRSHLKRGYISSGLSFRKHVDNVKYIPDAEELLCHNK